MPKEKPTPGDKEKVKQKHKKKDLTAKEIKDLRRLRIDIAKEHDEEAKCIK